MKGVWFDDIHSYSDLNLVLSKVDIPPATTKTNYVDIPGGDGTVDLTEAFGGVKYKDRKGSITFSVFPTDDFEEKKRQVSNLLNGRRFKIRIDKDPDYYWLGRCEFNKYASKKKLHQITMNVVVAPYKFKNEQTRVFVPFCGKNLLDVSESNQAAQAYGSVEYITNGVRKSGQYFVAYPVAVNAHTTYYFSVNIKCLTSASVPTSGGRIAIYDKNIRTIVTSYPSTEGTAVFHFNSGDHTELSVLFYSDSEQKQGVYEFTNAQLEEIQVTAYEPYSPTTEPIEITLTNGRKPVCPTIYCTGEATIVADDAEYTVGEGTHKILDFQLAEGENHVTVSGTGAVTFVYQEGDL